MIFEFKLQRALRPHEVPGDRSARAEQGDFTCCDGSGGRSRNPTSASTNSALQPHLPSP
jgi:hypothetical protein